MTIGLTGGIGSGKTTVAKMFKDLGVPVYNSDDRAKEMMNTSTELIERIKDLIGEEAYVNDSLNREYIAAKVFKDRDLLNALNEIVHPAVKTDFKEWASNSNSDYVIQEAAILFENGSYDKFDKMILVTAPKKTRFERIMQRDYISADLILERMNNQWEDEKKIPLADFVIENIELENTKSEVRKIHQKLLELSTNKGF